MKQLCTAVILATAFGIMLVAIGSVGSVIAQTNTTSNAASGNTTGTNQNATGNQSGTETASDIENLTKGNAEYLTNSSEVTDNTTGLADLQKEQTTTDSNMTTPTK
jgi:hypothetical protein